MAGDKEEVSSTGSDLKYLAFVRVVFFQAIAWTLTLYGASRAWLGALQTVVSLVEAAVTFLSAPVYTKLKGLPDKVLQFLDNKIDAHVKVYFKYAPSFVRKVVGAVLNATLLPAIVAVQVAGVSGPRAAIRYIVGEIHQAIRSLLSKFRQFLLALFMKIGQYIVSKLTAMFLKAIETVSVRKALVPLIPKVIGLLGKCNQGIAIVLGGITSATDKSSAALSWVPVVGGATKAAAGVASAAQTILAKAVEKSVGAVTGIQLPVELAQPAAD